MNPHSFDTSTESFERDVIEASRTVPIVVDFWAPWCAPCRVLKPVLERLAVEYGGSFRLAKLNTDENQEIAARYGIRSIPNVKAFVGGELADQFTGVLPESAVRVFLTRVIPTPAKIARQAARGLIAAGDFEEAEARLREATELDPTLHPARIDLAELLVARHAFEEAGAVLELLPEVERNETASRLATQIDVWRKARELPDLTELAARLERSPEDPALRFALAERMIAEMQFEGALEELIAVVRATRGEQRNEARKAMLRVFSLAAERADLVGEYRRLLAAELN